MKIVVPERAGLGGFNVGLEQSQWAIVNGLGFILKDDPETCHRNFDSPRREWLLRFDTPRGIIWKGTWRTLHPRQILHAPGAISVYSLKGTEKISFSLDLI